MTHFRRIANSSIDAGLSIDGLVLTTQNDDFVSLRTFQILLKEKLRLLDGNVYRMRTNLGEKKSLDQPSPSGKLFKTVSTENSSDKGQKFSYQKTLIA